MVLHSMKAEKYTLPPPHIQMAALLLHQLLGNRYERLAGDRAAAQQAAVVKPGVWVENVLIAAVNACRVRHPVML